MTRGEIFRVVAVSAVMALASFVVSKANFFDLDHTTGQLSDRIMQVVRAPFYGGNRLARPDKVTVILIDDDHARALHDRMGVNNWPPAFADFSSIIDQLTQTTGADGKPARPDAVFLDYTFAGPLVTLTDGMDKTAGPAPT